MWFGRDQMITSAPMFLSGSSAPECTNYVQLKILTYLMILNDGFRHRILLVPLRQTRSLFWYRLHFYLRDFWLFQICSPNSKCLHFSSVCLIYSRMHLLKMHLLCCLAAYSNTWHSNWIWIFPCRRCRIVLLFILVLDLMLESDVFLRNHELASGSYFIYSILYASIISPLIRLNANVGNLNFYPPAIAVREYSNSGGPSVTLSCKYG